jgi:hypothetical protein
LLCCHCDAQVAAELDKGTLQEAPPGWIRPGEVAEGAEESGSSGAGQQLLLCIILWPGVDGLKQHQHAAPSNLQIVRDAAFVAECHLGKALKALRDILRRLACKPCLTASAHCCYSLLTEDEEDNRYGREEYEEQPFHDHGYEDLADAASGKGAFDVMLTTYTLFERVGQSNRCGRLLAAG